MIKFLLFILLSLSSVLLVSCDSKLTRSKIDGSKVISPADHNHGTKSYYTCSMHPQVKEDKPGKCPICHMNLTKVEISEDDEEEINAIATNSKESQPVWACKDYPDVTSEKEDVCPIDGTPMEITNENSKSGKVIAKVKLRKAQIDHFFPAVFPVTKMKMTKNVRLLGKILQSEEKESKIPARIDGRVEKVFVKSTGAYIKKGDPVIELYSPQLITAGEEFILAKKSYLKRTNQQMKELLKQSEERLKLWGIKEFQLDRWVKNGSVPNSIKIFSNASGVVQKRNAVVGKYFVEGQNFFELSDLASVWVEMDVYEHDSALVSMDQKVELSFSALPKKKYKGAIDFISPVLDPKTRTVKVRTTIENSDGLLKPGMVADAVLTVEYTGLPLVVPRTAIIDTGKKQVVWKQISSKKYQAVLVETGIESEGYTEIASGLKEYDKIVIEGNFLLDAQAQLFGGYEDIK